MNPSIEYLVNMTWKKPSEDLSKFLDEIFIRLSEPDRLELVSNQEAKKVENIAF